MKYHSKGFTLIELMIAVAIVGLLAAIAYPSYLDQVRKSRRSEVRSALLQAANRQERYYTTQYEYATNLADLGIGSDLTEGGWYKISVQQPGGKDTFLIAAVAQKDQTKDTCLIYTINQIGEKKTATTGFADASQECW